MESLWNFPELRIHWFLKGLSQSSKLWCRAFICKTGSREEDDLGRAEGVTIFIFKRLREGLTGKCDIVSSHSNDSNNLIQVANWNKDFLPEKQKYFSLVDDYTRVGH